jgi:hypothetical protein
LKQFGKYFLIGLVVLLGCDGGEPVKQVDGPSYFPLRTGYYQVYTVEENIYSEVNTDEFLVYELKTEVVDSFPNLGGGFTFVIHRSTRPTENDSWEFLDTWSAQINEFKAVLTEGNISYVQMTFPIFKNREWNSNSLNTMEEDLYSVDYIGGSIELVTDLTFDDVLVIGQEDVLNELKKDQREEVYAPGVGLIYKKSIVINYCDEGPCFGQQIIKDGVEYWQTLKEYGQN